VVHDFKGDDHMDIDGGGRSRKRSGEVYATHPPRPSTFLEGDFNYTLDDQCQFHRDGKYSMRECEQLKCAIGIPPEQRRPRVATMTTKTMATARTTATGDLTVSMTTGIIMIIAATIVAMIDEMIVVTTTAMMNAAMTDMTTIVATTMMATAARSLLLHLHLHLKREIPTMHSRTPSDRST
jgi:hypothetical protein